MTNNKHADHHRPHNAVGGQNLESVESLSEVKQKLLVLDSDFRKWGEGKVVYYNMHVFGGLGFKAVDAKRMLLHFLTQGILDPRAMPCRVVVGSSHSHS